MMSARFVLCVSIIVLGYLVGTVAAGCDACSAEPDGGWGSPDYSDDPTWGMSFDDLTDHQSSSDDGSSIDDSSSQDSSGGGSAAGGDSSSSDSGSSSPGSGQSTDQGLVWRMIGDSLFEKGLYNESIEAYGKALRYDPYALKSWTGLGHVYLEVGTPEKAAEAFTKATGLDPGDASLFALLGDAWSANGSYEEAITSYQKALSMNPKLDGISEKIAITSAAMTGEISGPGLVNETLPVPDENKSTLIPTEIPRETIPDASELPQSTQATLPGLLGLAALMICFGFSVKRNR